MDFHSVMETFAEAWVAANTHTPLTEAAEQGLINGPTNHNTPNHGINNQNPGQSVITALPEPSKQQTENLAVVENKVSGRQSPSDSPSNCSSIGETIKSQKVQEITGARNYNAEVVLRMKHSKATVGDFLKKKIVRNEKHYSKENLIAAIREIEKGCSLRSVAKKYNIARSTLQRKIQRDAVFATKKGPNPILGYEHESKIVLWITSLEKAGFSITREILMHSVNKLANEFKISFPGENGLPGRKWFESFRRRHQNIKIRTNLNLATSRQQVTQESINNWFQEVENYIETKNLKDALFNPRRIFNCNEQAFYLNPKLNKVLTEEGSKNVYTAAGPDEEFHITALLTSNAAGELAPPMIIDRYNRIPQQVAEAINPNWTIGKSENGWITQETFYEYIKNIFEPYLRKEGIETPVILFMDGHCSYLSFHLSAFCMSHGIELVALLPNATHLLQPMDVAAFHALKTIWRQEVMNFGINNEGSQMQKHNFPEVLKSALNRLSPDTISNGFKSCGIVPWDPKKVVVSKKTKSQASVSPTKIEEYNFLRMLEKKIGETKLKMFSENVGKWNGPVEQTGLYYLWLEAKSASNLQLLRQLVEPTEEHIDSGDPVETLVVSSEDDEIIRSVTSHTKSVEQSTVKEESVKLHNVENKEDYPIAGSSKTIPSPFKRALF